MLKDPVKTKNEIVQWIRDYFEENGKPAPDIAIESMRRAGCTPEESIVVGDSTFDMSMGCNAGCRCLGVTYGSHDRQTLLDGGATWVVDDFRDIAKIILD